jgi:hypothetical protein
MKCWMVEQTGAAAVDGDLLTAVQVVSDIVQRHQAARARVTDEVVDAFMAVRPMPHLFG